jgi:lipopolysaccharide/colanic/teichoic acid biosynthesis glycosyltransferase
MLSKREQNSKRFFDVILSLILLPFVIFPLILLLVVASIDTQKCGLFVQTRVGRNGKLFKLYKIRTLRGVGHKDVHDIKASETLVGKWLRTSKLDELPQLFNVLSGTMSWVGPRPDIKGYADKLKGDDEVILTIRPGVTGPATIKYRNEETLLLAQENANEYNDIVIWPDKVKINRDYVKNWSLNRDIRYLYSSLFK